MTFLTSLTYKLVDRRPEPCPDLDEWMAWWAGVCLDEGRRVGETEVGACRISTVFLGVGNPGGLFETMCFGGPMDKQCERCGTWDQAETQHEAAVARARGFLKLDARHKA